MPTHDTGILVLTAQSTGIYTFPVQSFAGGGVAAVYPFIRIYQEGYSPWSHITVAQKTDNQTLEIPLGTRLLVPGDVIDIYCDPNGPHGQIVLLNNTNPYTATGTFPTEEPTTTRWLITIAASVIGAPNEPSARAVWTWTSIAPPP